MGSSPVHILAHRGLWQGDVAKNSLQACKGALEAGFGIEVDVRDRGGELVVAHDVADMAAYPFSQLAVLLKAHPGQCAAINVKSCGLQTLIKQQNLPNYFLFDMAVPDLRACLRENLPSFTRQSEIEPEPVLYAGCRGVWLDMFESDWATPETVLAHMDRGKSVALVSPELHGRPHLPWWCALREALQTIAKPKAASLYLCTDHPQEAGRFF